MLSEGIAHYGLLHKDIASPVWFATLELGMALLKWDHSLC
jgi:hypothetical protein